MLGIFCGFLKYFLRVKLFCQIMRNILVAINWWLFSRGPFWVFRVWEGARWAVRDRAIARRLLICVHVAAACMQHRRFANTLSFRIQWVLACFRATRIFTLTKILTLVRPSRLMRLTRLVTIIYTGLAQIDTGNISFSEWKTCFRQLLLPFG